MLRVLIVHEDPKVAERFRHHVLTRESEWEVRGATSEAEGRALLADWQPGAIVALARAPRLDGIALLAEAREALPASVRIAIGVVGEEEQNLRTLRLAHRGVSEPVEPPALLEMLRRVLLLSQLVAAPDVRQLLGRIGGLPAVPSVYTQLSRRLEDPNASVFELAGMVVADATLAAQVLRIANSAFFGRQQRVTTIEVAAARLGTRLLRSLVLTAEVYERFPVSPFMAERLEALQAHASLVARLAANLEPVAPWRDDAFTAGLLHDIGKVLLAAHLAEAHASIVREAERTGRPECEIELQRLGAHHGTLGACLLGMWGLPSIILEAAHRHHDPPQRLPQTLDPAIAVTIANALAHEVHPASAAGRHAHRLPSALLEDARLPHWRELAAEATQLDQAA